MARSNCQNISLRRLWATFGALRGKIPPTGETVRKVEIELLGGRSLRVRGYLSSHLYSLRKSVDESIVGDSDKTHPQITQITRIR